MSDIERKKDNKLWITERTTRRKCPPKVNHLYRELVEHVKSDPVLTSIYEMNIARQKEKT